MTHIPSNSDDEILRNKIMEIFAADIRIADANLRVGVLNGIVHLAGTLSSSEIRIAAAELVSELPGVRGLVNRIEAPGSPSPGRSIDIKFDNDKEKSVY
jgi:osmotically-inducible protein OsmY